MLKENSILFRYIILPAIIIFSYGVMQAQTGLTLEQSHQLALKHNQQIISGNEFLESAKNLQKASFTKFLPTFQFMGDYTRMNKQFRYEQGLGLDKILQGMVQVNPAVSTDPFYQTLAGMAQQGLIPNELDLSLGEKNNYLLTFSATQPLFTGGKIRDQYRISKYSKNAAEISLLQTKTEIIMKTDTAYWTTVSVGEKVKLAHQYQSMLQSHVTDLQNMLDEGLITNNDLLKAQVKKTDSDIQVMQAENGYALSHMVLNQLLGLSLDDRTPLLDSLSNEIHLQTAYMNQMKTPLNRPEIQQLQQVMGISKTMLHLAKSDYFPNLMLQGNYTYINPNPYNSLQTEFGHDWQISLLAQWQLFDWNARGFDVSAARHKNNALQAKLNEATEMVNLEIEQSRMKYDVAVRKTEMTHLSLRQAEENLRNATEQFHEGVLTSSEVLDAQTTWQQSYSNWIEAQADAHIQETTLRKALGILVDKENS